MKYSIIDAKTELIKAKQIISYILENNINIELNLPNTYLLNNFNKNMINNSINHKKKIKKK